MIRKNDEIAVFRSGRQVHTWTVLSSTSKGYRIREEDTGKVALMPRGFSADGHRKGHSYRRHRKGTDPWWIPRFDSFAEASRHMFDVVADRPSGDGQDRFRVLNVPIMKTYSSRETKCDEPYLDRMVANFHMPIQATSHLAGGGVHGGEVADKYGFRPKVHLHHTTDDPGGINPEVVGHIQDMYRAGPFIMADLGGLDSHSLGQLRAGKYPDRSPEVDPKRARILSVALLGAECPHFAFPQMRHFRFQDKVQRHGSENVPSVWHRFKGDELMNIYQPFAVLERFRSLPENDERRIRFERLFHDHMQEMPAQSSQSSGGTGESGGGMMGGGGVAGIEQLIRNVILQMQSEKFNTTPTTAAAGAGAPMYGMGAVPGATGMGMGGGPGGGTGAAVPTPQHFSKAVDDILDLENNSAHHASSGRDPTEMEPGTKVEGSAESPTEPMPGPQSGDAGVTERGQPSSAEPKDGGVDEFDDQADESGLKNELDRAVRTVRHAMESNAVDDQTGAALNVLMEGQQSIVRHVKKLVSANLTLNNRVSEQAQEIDRRRKTERHQAVRENLIRMRAEGYVSIGDEQGVERHAQLIGSLNPDQERLYFENLQRGGKIHPGARVRFQDVDSSKGPPIAESVQRHQKELEQDPELREAARALGFGSEELALAEAWAEMDSAPPLVFGERT